ncbi:phosphatidylserine decarboxylase [Muriicola jejuensis]|uniref:Phosphatidylserine decarboxylase family protein n=1 Tax=Muriicola jejuensis TaxID=504488 RepID=A0A6P0UD89_9FLAO|nr:phosphatidylserine decarboxylase family protein [Muriicola jejuensis]NER09243.1 phosphatidylserine decarboxylase family protein [Muriicola jejuensis]SMP09996.1 phosphatidylserine decarboxylase [Muriicola jejuensis]
MFHKEGQKIILFTFFIIAILVFLADRFISADWVRITVQIVAILILVSILQFFRNPRRVSNKNFNEIHAPVDGKVVVIERVMETEYFQEERLQISIFMSPVNVHVTRYPASGVIKYSKYHPGKYLVAWHPKSSEENERTTVVIRTPKFGDILYRQIAGAMARRIVNYAEEGESVQQGEESGFIKFGSRVDVFLPLNAMVSVKLNQKVKGAVTCLASLNTDDGEG